LGHLTLLGSVVDCGFDASLSGTIAAAMVEVAFETEGAGDALAVLVPEPPDGFPAVDRELRSRLEQLGAELRGARGEAIVVHVDGTRVVAAGIGARDRVDLDALRTAAAATASALA